MFTILIGAVIGFLLAALIVWNNPWEDFKSKFMITIMFAFIGAAVGCASAIFIGNRYEQVPKIIRSEEIVAVKDNGLSGGSFFLGSGTVDSEPTYFYMAKEQDGYIQKTVDADEVIVIEGSDSPRIEKYVSVFKDEKNNRFAITSKSFKTKIFVPSNSIKRTFGIDLE